jgi:membrane-bound metal-dependent hydrolase YbcI (DUF457 family)
MMKGIAHFAVGVAVATFFPEIIQDAAQSLAFGPVLAGIAGLLPDTLDFKLLRYLQQPDEVIDPARFDPAVSRAGLPDPQPMATCIAAAVDRAYESGRRVRLQLHTLKLGSDLWRRWSIEFDVPQRRVHVRLGLAVTTAQVAQAGSTPPGPNVGSAPVRAPLLVPDGDEIVVDIFSGPSLALEPVGGAVEVVFLPWHRAWTHSLLAVVVLGLLGSLLTPIYGLALALAVLAHILVDQLGFMGSNLLFPLTRRRTRGLGLFHSGDALPNFLAVWTSGVLILFNLDRFSAQPILAPWPYFSLALALPALLLLGTSLGSRQARSKPVATPMGEALDEAAEVDI